VNPVWPGQPMANWLNIPVPRSNVKLRRDAEVTLPPPDEWWLKCVGWVVGKSAALKAETRQYSEASVKEIVKVIRLPRKAS
jgi:hypothetical protein